MRLLCFAGALFAGLAMLLVVPGARAQGGVADAVELRVEQFGIGNVARAGGWAAIRVGVRDLGVDPRDVLLRVASRDPDGDLAYYDRQVVTNSSPSGVGAQSFWLYVPLPRDQLSVGDPVVIAAYEAVESTGSSPTGYDAGRMLAEITVRPQARVVSRYQGLIAVIGGHDFGLGGYAEPGDQTGAYPARSHELARVISGLGTDDLPDRWHGWDGYEAIVWGGIGDRFDPSRIDLEHARAIEQWVRRGGHLVVILPSVGQTWTNPQSNRLIDIFPKVAGAPVRHEGVDLAAWRAAFTDVSLATMPRAAVVQELRADPNAGPGEAVEVLRSPEGWTVALRRNVGAGAVTVLGVDVSSSGFRRAGALQADVFWHRILGRRGNVMTWDQVKADANYGTAISGRGQSAAVLDARIGGAIAKGGRSLTGLLFAIVIFALYWVAAGPGGFALLSKFKQRKHAWMAFVAVTAVCTGIAWTGALALRPSRVEANHMTVMVAAHGQETATAKMWASVLVPRYGDATLAIGAEGDKDPRLGADWLRPWRPAGTSAGGGITSFPDNRGYEVDARAPETLRVPTRSTVKQVVGSWAGPMPAGMIKPVATPGDPEELRVERRAGSNPLFVSGELAHSFPAPLTNVTVFTVFQQEILSPMRASLGDNLVSGTSVRAISLPRAWLPGTSLNLEQEFRVPEGESLLAYDGRKVLEDLVPRANATGLGIDVDVDRGMRAALLYSALPPWEPRSPLSKLVQRTEMHGLDLGRWFTQPCVIVIADYETGEGIEPLVPVRVDDRIARAQGRTVLAWVYPLESNPPRWATENTQPDSAGPADGAGANTDAASPEG